MSEHTVHIVDDDAAVRDALDSLFRSVGLETRLFATAQDFFKSGHAHDKGCLVLDIRLPGVSGLDFQAQLNTADIHMPVVLMTGHGDIPMTVRGMKAGAVDFLAKPFRDQDMLDAVMAAIAKDETQRQERTGVEEARQRYETLTARERQVMGLVATGLMNKQIAFEIGLSEITVKIHRSTAMRKMGAKSMLEFARLAELLGLKATAAS